MYIHIYTHFPAYQTAQKADRRSGRNTSTHTLPCLPDRTKGRSPVREKHKHTHTSLPTRPHKRQIAGQGETQAHTHFPAYQTAQKADRRSGRNTSTHTLPCLPDRTKGRSPVREKHKYTHTSLPTRPHKRQIASQEKEHIHVLLLQACTYMYLRARCTVEVQFPFCRSSGSGRVRTTLIIFTLGDRRNRRRSIWKCYWPGLAINSCNYPSKIIKYNIMCTCK